MKKKLIELKLKKLHLDYPRFPIEDIPKPTYTDSTSNGLTKMVIDWITLNGGMAERTGNMGRYIDNKKIVTDVMGHRKQIGSGKYIPGSGTKGTSDVKAVIAGRMFAIEIKIRKDKQSEAQIEYQKKVESAGGIYFVAKTFDEFYLFISNYLPT